MAFRRAIGAVKDQTTIGLAKVGNSNSLADLDVAIVRATSHDEYPADEKYYREIFSLTCYSRNFVASCVNTISRRLSKTKNWVVALKTLMLIQRLLVEGDPAYEQEIFFTTRRGTRMLNMSDFRDSRSNSWDYSAFVRMYALYLDERLEYKMQGRRKPHHHSTRAYLYSNEQQQQEERYQQEQYQDNNSSSVSSSSTRTPMPNSDLTLEQILSKMHHLQQLLERFLATRPTGSAKHNRIVIVALYSAVRDSFQIYYDITDILGILIDQFMEIDIPDCIKVHEIFCRISKQFDELDSYYLWCKDIGVVRSSEYPDVERITQKKLDLMDEFIRDKAANAKHKLAIMDRREEEKEPEPVSQEDKEPEDMNTIKALPPAEGFPPEEEEKEPEPDKKDEEPEPKEADLLNLGDDAPTSEEHGDKLALALFDGAMGDASGPAPPPMWEVFNDNSDWETALVQSASYLPHQKPSLGGGFDTMLLDGMYQQGVTNAAIAANRVGGSGSASSVALGSIGNPQLLALPAPPSSSGSDTISTGNVDPFAASLGVAPPPFVQMSELEKKQRRLVEEQLMWQQYQRDGMQGHVALSKIQQKPANTGGNGYGYNGYHYGY
ncbi:putative clathrin assembly protein At1g03050 [Beta vulgaris subsp. vulgaris]|uniref:putative clathrin assembly protein At1g03050 n=1 Tax=Beta vulgaris subsp. vulgaris TaxID=3555 RepID=UPI002548AF3F|nr:putative clathrin assembly protein At1g03050 [Beta vulgaris subsp. vulgaris]